jgi:ankyrin repeat protein
LSHAGSEGWTPLMTATYKGSQEIVAWMLLNFHADREGKSLLDFINMRDKDGKTAIDLADSACRDLIEKYLTESAV